MTTRLTLSIDAEKVKKIKRYTKAKGISVSQFLEQQIDTVTSNSKKKQKDVSMLLGAFGNVKEPFDWKALKTEHLLKKYGS
jgi:pyridoxine 5'-phosphate synthase PdxJ